RRLALPTAIGLALLFGLGAAGGWLGVLQFLHRTPFGVTDPVFGRDVGYYVFTVPVIAGAIGLVIAVTTLTLLATIMLYGVRRDIVVFRRQVTVEPSARLHLAVLIALLFVLVALWVYFVRLPGLLYSTTGPLVGASLADPHAQLTRRPTIDNVRLWDRDPLLQTFGQLQGIRTYYDFVSVDDDRYWIDGQYRQVLLSPRELNSGSLPTRTFINERLTFTHGMGLTPGPVNQVTPEGLPVLFIKDLPPASSVSL